MFQNSTPGELLVLAFGGILALATIVSVIGSAIEKVLAIAKTAKAPEAHQNREIEEIKTRLSKVEGSLKTDEAQILDSIRGMEALTEGMLALLEHGINGNNIDQMREAKKGIEAYLIHH